MKTNHQSPRLPDGQAVTSHQLSAVVITYNVAHIVGECLAALRKVTDDIVVLDSFSDDGTVEICRQAGVRLVSQEWLGYSATKNLGNSMARHDWVLSIDSDEVLSDELIASLKKWAPEKGKVYVLDRLTNYCGKWVRHSGWYPDWKTRLFDRREVEWQGDFVHETLRIPTDYQQVRLKGKLHHYSYRDAEDHLRRLEKYARLSAEERFAAGKKATFVKLWLSPPARFIATFLLKKGFLDGRTGWQIAKRDAYMVRLRYRILRGLWRGGGL